MTESNYNYFQAYRQSPYGFNPQSGASGQVPTYGTGGSSGSGFTTQPQGSGYGFPGAQVPTQAGATLPPTGVPSFTGGFAPSAGPQIPGMLPLEQSYIENILRLNKGKLTTVYTNFDTGSMTGETLAKSFTGIIEAAGRDHLILSDPQSGTRYLIPMVYFAYATFNEELEYDYPFGGAMPGATTYSPR